jgi:hypothetical protein
MRPGYLEPEGKMDHLYRNLFRALTWTRAAGVSSILALAALASFCFFTPLSASQRMVLAEGYTNTG